MLLRRVAVENARSFLDRTEFQVDGGLISILIGPNGGGKTNLLDIIVIMIRRHLFASKYAVHTPTEDDPEKYEFRDNDVLSNMRIEKHSSGANQDQIIELELELTDTDITNIYKMKRDALVLASASKRKYLSHGLERAAAWDLAELNSGDRFSFILRNGTLNNPDSQRGVIVREYLNLFEIDNQLRADVGSERLALPIVYLPVTRSGGGIPSQISVHNYNDFEVKRQNDGAYSRNSNQLVYMALARIARSYRLKLEEGKDVAEDWIKSDENLKALTESLRAVGYSWELMTANPLTNEYKVVLAKQGITLSVDSASSGEKELLTYLFAIYGLGIRNALVIVDEPELHLHPKWQRVLLDMFLDLSKKTGNQFLLATHSASFISAASIKFVSRVFSQQQKSQVTRLDADGLPNPKHLFALINSMNNERIFFSDAVLLVEGVTDRLFFEAALKRYAALKNTIVEVVSVGGKGMFSAYEKLLRACKIPHVIIADLDYVEQIGTAEVKALFKIDAAEIKKDVFENVSSMDAEAFVRHVDRALSTGSWEQARDVWDYIKTRRRQLIRNLDQDQRVTLQKFLADKRNERVFLLEKGALEAYLPDGYKAKDVDKLIDFVSNESFWDRLAPVEAKDLDLMISEIVSHVTS